MAEFQSSLQAAGWSAEELQFFLDPPSWSPPRGKPAPMEVIDLVTPPRAHVPARAPIPTERPNPYQRAAAAAAASTVGVQIKAELKAVQEKPSVDLSGVEAGMLRMGVDYSSSDSDININIKRNPYASVDTTTKENNNPNSYPPAVKHSSVPPLMNPAADVSASECRPKAGTGAGPGAAAGVAAAGAGAVGAAVSAEDERLIAAAGLDAPLSNGWTLYPHQRSAVVSCIVQRRAILAFDMGLGKTIITLLWAKAFCLCYPNCSVIIVAPCTLLENWKREASVAFHGIESEHCIQYASWAKIPSAAAVLAGARRSSSSSSSSAGSFVLICDEAHAMQSASSARTRAAVALCESAACRGAALATGTVHVHHRMLY
jgi:hypothetical protein